MPLALRAGLILDPVFIPIGPAVVPSGGVTLWQSVGVLPESI